MQQLLPPGGAMLPLEGLYLDREADRLAATAGGTAPLVYANFVTSLDGRIALGADEAASHVPKSLATAADWRLFQELQAHADGFITHGAYLRALAAGRLGDILQVGLRRDAADLLAWRRARGPVRQPAVIVASASLDFTLPTSLREHGQRVVVVTSAAASATSVNRLRDTGVDVRVTGDGGSVAAQSLVRVAAELGCRRVYLQSGPVVLEAMLRAGLLRRLYLTISTLLMGGEAFHSLLRGPGIGGAGRLALDRLYHLAGDGDAAGQLFGSFSPHPLTQE